MQDIEISPAKSTQIEHIQQVLSTTWMDTYSTHIPNQVLQDASAHWHSAEFLKAQLSNPDICFPVVISNGRCVAIATAGGDDEVINLFRLYILPEFQRMGIGKKLLHNVIEHFPKGKSMRVKVEAFNSKGRSFYQKNDFIEIGRETEKIGNSEIEEIIMEKKI